MRYETAPQFIRPQPRGVVRKPTLITKEEEDNFHGEHPNIYDTKTHARKVIFKRPVALSASPRGV